MTRPSLNPTFIFGVKSNIRGNVHYLSNNEILYPAGAVLSIHDVADGHQKYLNLEDKLRPISIICLTENRKFLAAADKGDPPAVSLYDLSTLKQTKKWILSRTDSPLAEEFVSISFSRDGKLLAGITGEPDWHLLCYNWDKNKLESSAKAQNPVAPGPILQASFSPEDNTIVCIAGPRCLRFLQHIETSWNQFGFARSEIVPVTSFCWLPQGKVLAGTRDGRLMLFEDGELKAMYNAEEIDTINTRTKVLTADGVGQSTVEQYIGGTPGALADANAAALKPYATMPGPMEIRPIISFSKGFAFGYGFGFIYVFWQESENKYQKRHVFKVPSLYSSVGVALGNTKSDAGRATREASDSLLSETEKINSVVRDLTNSSVETSVDVGDAEGSSVNSPQNLPKTFEEKKSDLTLNPIDSVRFISINPAQSEIIISTGRNQLYHASLWNADYKQEPITVLQTFGEELHDGPLSGLSICMQKPLFVTSGQIDKSVRIWNYETQTLELSKRFEDDIFCIDVHPTGLHLLVGFSDKLRFMNLLIDDLEEKQEISIRRCQECVFSYSGHLFAAANCTIIQIYSSLTFEMLYSFTGHKKMIYSLSWSKSNYRLVSCGYGGFIYEWDLPCKRRISETISAATPFTYAVISSDGSSTFASASDGKISEIKQSKIIRYVEWKNMKFNVVTLSHSSEMMFAGDDSGTIVVPQFPLSDVGKMDKFEMHNTAIKQMKISYDDRYLITASVDGSICIWKVEGCDDITIKLGYEIRQSNEILISKEDLQKKMELIQDLMERVKHLELAHEYKMRQKDDECSQLMKETQDNFYKELKEIKDINETMEAKHAKQINLMHENVVKMKASHESGVQQMEAEYNDKLIKEYEKYAELEENMKQTKEQYEMKLMQLKSEMESEINNLKEMHQEQIQQKITEIEELNQRVQDQCMEHEEITAQIEDDVDREIIEIRTRFEKTLREERDTNVSLKGEMGAVKKKLVNYQKEIDEYKHQVQALQSEQAKYKQVIQSLEKDIADLKREIQERDATIQYKEKRIYELQKKNQALEKYEFVLNFKLTELKNEKEPREREIKANKDHIQDMEKELGNLQATIEMLELKIKYISEKLSSNESELKNQRLQNHSLSTLTHRMQSDIYNASGLIQKPKELKEFVKSLNSKYNENKMLAKAEEDDIDASAEFQRQREHLERTVSALKVQLKKESRRSKKEHLRIMTENVTLLSEINSLRTELKSARKHIHDLEAVIGFGGKKGSSLGNQDARMKLAAAIQSHNEIQESYEKKMEDYERTIEMLKDEIEHQTSKKQQLQESATTSNEDVTDK